jgi:trehalose-phosphatase
MMVDRARQIGQRNIVPRRFNRRDKDPWQAVLAAKELFIFFEFDGTLVEIAPKPDDVVLSEARKRYLRDLLSAPGCSVAIVSGRPVDELRKLVGLDGLFYVGCHGLEWTAPDGTWYMSWPHKVVLDALQSLREQLHESLRNFAGVLLENKGIALALHYRKAKRDTASMARKEFARAVHWFQQQGVKLEIVAGKKVIEAKSAGAKKADAITQILARRTPSAVPIYIGDDLSDESAFHVIAEKGLAVSVTRTPRATAVTYYLKDPGDVYAYVRCLNAARRTRLERRGGELQRRKAAFRDQS